MLKQVGVSRALCSRWPFGQVLGEPGHRLQQRTVLRDALALLRYAEHPTVVDLPYRWRREQYPDITDWDDPGPTVAAALGRRRL